MVLDVPYELCVLVMHDLFVYCSPQIKIHNDDSIVLIAKAYIRDEFHNKNNI